MKFEKQEALSFQDVLLVPQYFDGISRSEIDISTELCGLKFDIPIISSNMKAITEIEMVKAFADIGGLPILHRMCPSDVQILMAQKCSSIHLQSNRQIFGSSFGIKNGWILLCQELTKYSDILCLDVAHSDQKKVIEVVVEFRKEFGDFPLIVGNYATPEGIFRLLEQAPVLEYINQTAFKVGIGGGSLCSTRIKTGCGVPTFQSILDCQDLIKENVQIIADGGIQNSGDIVKSLALGAKAVMIGSVIAGSTECPGRVLLSHQGDKVKSYFGNASYMAKGNDEHIEGEETLVPYKGPVKRIIKGLENGIRSGLSYCGASTLNELYDQAILRRITNAGWRESLPHALIK